jgi:hypothetical protein
VGHDDEQDRSCYPQTFLAVTEPPSPTQPSLVIFERSLILTLSASSAVYPKPTRLICRSKSMLQFLYQDRPSRPKSSVILLPSRSSVLSISTHGPWHMRAHASHNLSILYLAQAAEWRDTEPCLVYHCDLIIASAIVTSPLNGYSSGRLRCSQAQTRCPYLQLWFHHGHFLLILFFFGFCSSRLVTCHSDSKQEISTSRIVYAFAPIGSRYSP